LTPRRVPGAMADFMPELVGMDAHTQMVHVIKELQKSDIRAKDQWIKFTQLECGGTRDPAKHSIDLLQKFLVVRHQIEVPPPCAASFSDLFKEAQKNSPTFRQCWSAYRNGMAVRFDDPSKHTADFLQGAVEYMSHAAIAMMTMGHMGNTSGTQVMGAMMQAMEKKGSGEDGAAAALGAMGAIQAVMPESSLPSTAGCGVSDLVFGNPEKRARTEESITEITPAKPGLLSGKQALVEQVKAFQRSGLHHKEAWWTFTKYNGGNRDPALYEERQLQEFLQQQGLA